MTPKTLYVMRPVINSADIGNHFKSQGSPLIKPDDMHVTIMYSKTPVDWNQFRAQKDNVEILHKLGRKVTDLGDYIVQLFKSGKLQKHHDRFLRGGCSWDYPSYRSHVSLFQTPNPTLYSFRPYMGPIILGPEQFDEVKE